MTGYDVVPHPDPEFRSIMSSWLWRLSYWQVVHTIDLRCPTGGRPVSGRTVKVSLLGRNNDNNGYLSLAEVWIVGKKDGFSNVNLARKPGVRASQSSTGWGGSAGRAIDGNIDGNYQSYSVTHTANGVNSLWLADLGENREISRIVLHNRSDCCESRLSNFRVSVLSKAGIEVWGKNYFTGFGYVR